MCINIIDNGPGIDPRDLERIFSHDQRPLKRQRLRSFDPQNIISEHHGVIQVNMRLATRCFLSFTL